MALLIKITQPGTEDRFKVIEEDERAVELLDAGVAVWSIQQFANGNPNLRKLRVNEASRVTEVRTVSASTEEV